MKIRTTEQLLDRISDELAWRRQEILVFQAAVRSSNDAVQKALLRSSLALLYAHWEGFVKTCIHYYYCYLVAQKPTYQQLRPELAAVALRKHVREFTESNQAEIHTKLIHQVREFALERAKLPSDRDAVITGGNLNYERLCNLLHAVGCDYERYAEHVEVIDDQLLGQRNRVVHGEHEHVALTEWDEIKDVVLKVMAEIADQLTDSAIEKSYLAWRA